MAEEDLIFGKNRHLFGGIEPSNMIAFSAALDVQSNKIRITATLPEDTVINGQTLCSVAGAVIRRKLTDYPSDEFDGDLIADIKESVVMTDLTADPNGTYYYAAYPYTTQGVYNRNRANRVVINEPADMIKFLSRSIYNASTQISTVEITAELPSGVVGAVIRRSTIGYPTNENDGTLFMDVQTDGSYTDSNVEIGTTYYYSAFPYTSTGEYNRSGNNRTSVTVSKYEYLFGFDLDTNDSNPSTRITYPSDVDNAGFAKAAMNFETGVFDYGDWPSVPGDKFMPKPCMLTYAGVVDHYLNPDDYTKKEDGTASSVANTAFGGNAMMQWPKIFTKRWTDANGIYHFRCCDIALDDDYECWSNYDKNNNEIDHFYTPIYFGSSVSNRMRSISGQTNSVETSPKEEITLAKANGDAWYTEVLADRLLIQDLLDMISKSTDGQTSFGSGRSDSNNSSAIGQGTMNNKGLFWGSTNGTDGVKVFGMENWWGNLRRRTAGWINDDGVQKVKITRGTKDGSTATDYNLDGSGYLTIADATPSGTSGGYIDTMKTEPFGRLPVTANGSSSTYEADGMWFNNTGVKYASVGGSWIHTLPAGPFCVALNDATSYSGASLGAALSCKPLAP